MAATTTLHAGDPIPGSRYVRAFCPGCRRPMRVTKARFDTGYIPCCGDCDPAREPTESTLTAMLQRRPDPLEDDSPAWHNAVRCMEACG